MKQLLHTLQLLLGWPISILALFFVYQLISVHSKDFSLDLTNINIFFLFSGVLCFLCYFFTRAYLWQKILQHQKHNVPLRHVLFLWASSELRRFIPGNIWSILSRTLLFSAKKIDKKTVFVSLLKEAQFTLLGSLLLSVFSFSFVFYNLSSFFPYPQPAIFLTYGIVGSACLFGIYKKPNESTILIALSLLAFFFFGLGTYFTISSFVVLSPYYLLTFISFFTFSYVVGYLSLIAPMGLGVREGVITFGLSYFIPLAFSGFAAIFARVILILTEILFFILVTALFYVKSNLITKAEHFIKKYLHEILLVVFIKIYIIYFTIVSFLRYDNFYTGRFDLGNMDQTVWNTAHGRIFQLTDPNGTEIISRLAFHADFILVLLAPFYKLWADPRMLLLIQTIVVAFGTIFVFLIAKDVLKNKTLSLLFSFIFLANPSVQHATLYDFHAVTLATTLLLGSFFFLLKRQYIFFLIFSILAALTKEDVWIIVGLFGLYLSVMGIYKHFRTQKTDSKKFFLGLAVFVLSISFFFYLVWHAIPQARGTHHFALSYYSDFGDSPTNIIKNIIFSPQKTLNILVGADQTNYLFQLFFPLGFLSFFAPFFLLFALPDLLIKLLSNNAQLHQIYFHYTVTTTPFLFITAIYGLSRIQKLFPKTSPTIFSSYLLAFSLLAAYLLGPLPGAKNPNVDMFVKPQGNRKEISRFLSGIRKEYSVAATNNLGSHLSRRERIYTIPFGIEKADIVIFLLNDPFAQPSLMIQKQMASNLKVSSNYKLLFEKGDFVAFEKIKSPD